MQLWTNNFVHYCLLLATDLFHKEPLGIPSMGAPWKLHFAKNVVQSGCYGHNGFKFSVCSNTAWWPSAIHQQVFWKLYFQMVTIWQMLGSVFHWRCTLVLLKITFLSLGCSQNNHHQLAIYEKLYCLEWLHVHSSILFH